MLLDKRVNPTVMFFDINGYYTYVLACTNCGFVRQHLQPVVDGEVVAEVDYAQPRE